MNQLRCRLTDSKVEKQVSVAHNWTQLNRDEARKRAMFDKIISLRMKADSQRQGLNSNNPTDGVVYNADSKEGPMCESHASLNDSNSNSLQASSNLHDEFEVECDDFMPTVEELELEHTVWAFSTMLPSLTLFC